MMERRKTNRSNYQAIDANILDAHDVVKQIWRHKFLAVVFFAVPAVLGTLYIASRPAIYESTATVVLEESEQKIADIEEAFPGMKFDSTTTETQANIIKSPTLMREVITTLGLKLDGWGKLTSASLTNKKEAAPAPEAKATDPQKEAAQDYAILSKYAQGLTVTPARQSRVLAISFASENPYLSAEIAKAHTDQYLQSRVSLKQEQAKQLNDWIAAQVENLKKQSAEKSTAVEEFRQKNGMIKGRNEEELINQQVSDIAAELVPVQAKKADLQAQADAIASAKGDQAKLAAIQSSQVIQSLKTNASEARQELRALSSKYGQNHPLYVEAQNRVKQIEGDIARETRSIKDTIAAELATVTAQEKLLNEQLSGLKAESGEQRQKQIELEGLELEAAASTKLLDSFIARYEEVSSQLDSATPDVRILSEAEIPMQAKGGKKMLKIVVVLFLSAVFGCFAAFLAGFADRGVQSVDDVRKSLQLRFLGALPDVRNPLAEVGNGGRSTYLEEIKRIYLHLSSKPSVKTVLLTAAENGEGKSATTLALAAYLVSLGRKVLVIDADLNTPTVASLADVEEGPGLAGVLSGGVIASTAIRRDDRGVAILPAGNGMGSSNLLTADSFRSLLDGLKGSYDYILVDAAPVLDSTDAETAAGVVDMVVLVVAYGRTSRRNLKKAAETLRQFSSEVPSVVLNKADLKNVA